MGDCGPWGGAGEQLLLGATPFGAACRRPNRGCGPRAAAGAVLHNVTKPHLPRTYRDVGRKWASGAASLSTCQAGACTSRCHWSRTRKESQAARGPEEQVQFWGDRFSHDSDRRSSVRIVIKLLLSVRSWLQLNVRYAIRILPLI